jgi:hypothetical protein
VSPRRALALLLLVSSSSCERVARHPRPADAAPPPDAPPRRPDAPPPPDAATPDAPPPDAAPSRPDAGPGPRRRPRPDPFTCETDADCTIYGDPCGDGLIAINKRFEERAVRAARRRCPDMNMHYLGMKSDFEASCVDHRCTDGHSRSNILSPR